MNSADSHEASPIPVASVRLIVKNKEDQVLILRRPENSHGAGGWCLPGGKVDFGDTAEATAIKELAEETALSCTKATFLFYQDSLPSEDSEMHVINLYFECAAGGDLQLNEESTAHAWIAAAEMADYEFVFKNGEGLRRYWNTV